MNAPISPPRNFAHHPDTSIDAVNRATAINASSALDNASPEIVLAAPFCSLLSSRK